MASVFMDSDAVEGLSARLSDVASDLATRASVIEALLDEAGKTSAALDEIRQGADLVFSVGEDMLRRARMLRVADTQGWPGEIIDFLLGDVGNFWSGGDDGTMPWGSAAAGLFRTVRGPGYLLNYRAGGSRTPAPTTANGGLVQFIARRLGPGALNWLDSDRIAGLRSARGTNLLARGQGGLGTLGARAGWARGLGAAGGVVSTGFGVANLAQQGLPHNAFEERGTDYLADVASTAFSASSTAFFVAPNPVTAGLTIATGVAWLGLEAWNHREEIAEVWNDSVDAVGDLAGGAVEGGRKVVSALNPFD